MRLKLRCPVPFFFALWACTPSAASKPPGSDSVPDSESSAVASDACPAGMTGIPGEDPVFCIDTYEASLVDGLPVSVAGVLPEVGVTFDEAVDLCAASPAVNAEGVTYGARRLVTAAEWEDAGDGVLGAGGTVWPWGDDVRDVCATVGADLQPRVDSLQLTGAFPDCVSVSGVYDQIGNAWEWMDSGLVIDVDAALDALAAAGIVLSTDTSGLLHLDGGDSTVLELDIAGLSDRTVHIAADGTLQIEASQIDVDVNEFFAKGWLMVDRSVETMLPVALEADPTDGTAPWSVRRADEYEGATIPDKRGCAWYAGDPSYCSLGAASYAHLPDFDGTIGFRCVAEPYFP